MKVEIYRTVIFVLLPQIRAVDIEVSTADNRKYVKLSTHCIVAAGRSFYTFQVKAKNDAHIALMSEDDDARPLYEIVIGGWGNKKSCIRTDVRCTLQAFNNTRIVENYTDCVGTTTYECDSGYFLHSGNLQRTCFSNRTWSGEPPYCKQISCPQISSTVSYAIQHQDTDIGGNVTAVCSDNFRHSSGHLTRECTSNGSWDGEEPVCLRCRCPCSLIGQQGFNSSSELEQRLKQLKRELEIAKNSTSSFYRKRNCALDNRLSSASLGYLCGYGVIISIAVYLVIPDLSILYRHFRFGAD
ncbi:sushi, von Willebrand factor type A, EGF and pentraxin domain-containing protein 1-like isoform X2 [Saccostrea echinata]|uniref:sushi, von Willebrand factor type A, EGF and pentraxin domain-containing protein 1-like isoform X2 n=1 Tax=Saccostrea echinata TaxID=191078 RepID=UPI002A83AF35|nr:sushi, von Willebrand factor type A, EGF and pentraxin domain-containing protein 1-like isoform X2 [Saccostrea echinata]